MIRPSPETMGVRSWASSTLIAGAKTFVEKMDGLRSPAAFRQAVNGGVLGRVLRWFGRIASFTAG